MQHHGGWGWDVLCELLPFSLRQVSVFVPWQSCVFLPKKHRDTGARGRVAAGHLCGIAEAVLEPQLLLRKAGSLPNHL